MHSKGRKHRLLTITCLSFCVLLLIVWLRLLIEKLLWVAFHYRIPHVRWSHGLRSSSHSNNPQEHWRPYNKVSSGVLIDDLPIQERIRYYSKMHDFAVKERAKVSNPSDITLQRFKFNEGAQTIELEYCLKSLKEKGKGKEKEGEEANKYRGRGGGEERLTHSNVLETVEQQEEQQPYLLTLFTTMHPSTDSLKILAQQNILESYAYLSQFSVKAIIFTDDLEWKKRATKLGITVISEHAGNRHGTPYLHDMYIQAMKKYPNSYFYSFTNADILFTSRIISTLCSLRGSIESRDKYSLRRKILIVGRRSNYNLKKKDILSRNMTSEEMNKKFNNFYEKSELFQKVAQDYFIVTKDTFDWNKMPKYVIGRVAYDNCLVSQAVEDHEIDTVDATKTVRAIHLTGEFYGDFLSFYVFPCLLIIVSAVSFSSSFLCFLLLLLYAFCNSFGW
jgi:hypothetical protein